MKLSMMTYTMARGLKSGQRLDPAELCRFTRELGLDAIDWVTTYGYDAAGIRRITDDHGLRNIVYTFFCDLNFPEPAQRAAGREAFRCGLEAAVTLGAGKIMLPVGGKPGLSRQQSFRNYLDGLKEVIPLAQAARAVVTVENFPDRTGPFITSADMNAAIAEVPALRVTFDNGNVVTGGESAPESFARSAAHVVHAHFKDFALCDPADAGGMIGLDGRRYRGVLVGDGMVDQPGTLRAMVRHGYQEYIDFEYEGSQYTPRDATIEGIRRLRAWMAAENLG